jgi:hypothetical protein
MSTATLDQAADLNGQETYRIHGLYGTPPFVKEATADRLCGDEKTEPHMFADVTHRRWPCHTAPATWMSAAFFYEKKASLSANEAELVETRIQESATFYGIAEEVDQLREKIAVALTSDESQLDDDAFAIVANHDDGRKVRKYPMRNALEVQKAASYLAKHRDSFRFSDNMAIADKIRSKSVEFGADVSEHRYLLEKLSGLGACASADAAALVRSRIGAMGNTHQPTQLQTELEKLAAKIEANPEATRHHTSLTKIATIVDSIDHDHGFTRAYGTVLERPEDVLFGVTEKIAADMTDEIIGSELTGNFYKRSELGNLPISTLGAAMGDDFAAAISTANAWVDTEKLASILPTLPLDDAEMFDAVVLEAGIAPYATKSAQAVGVALEPQELTAAASAHTPAPGSLWDQIGDR